MIIVEVKKRKGVNLAEWKNIGLTLWLEGNVNGKALGTRKRLKQRGMA